MTDKPILFSAPMVRALLAGTKTQTRRALNPQPNMFNGGLPLNNGHGSYSTDEGWKRYRIAVGDRLWVREGWIKDPWDSDALTYRADGEHIYDNVKTRWKPSIYMPRWASRLTLHVTDVRVQRLQEISETDAIAEGIVCVGSYLMADSISSDPLVGYSDDEAWSHDPRDPAQLYELPMSAKGAYRRLWDSINGAGSWSANPWVMAVTFSVERANIDSARIAA